MKPFACLSALVLAATFVAATPAMAAPADTPMAAVPAAPKLDAALRALWHGHVVHARDYALAVHAHDPAGARAAADAVVANARQIAGAVGGFYGKPAGAHMLDLLAGHWAGLKALTDARAADDAAAERKAMADLQANAGQIARFLAAANPNLPENALRGMLAVHVAHHATEVQQIMTGDRTGEQATWEAIQAHMDMLSDALAAAIAKQFPAKAA